MNKRSLENILMVIVAGAFVVGFTGCSRDKSQPNIELLQDMMEQAPDKAQEYDDFFPNHSAAQLPPENTVPRGFKPYLYATDLAGALRELKNPIQGDMTHETLVTGQKFYDTNCAVCHGFTLKGDGPVSLKMPLKPPPLNSDKVKGWPDAQIYHAITVGQGVMGPYASHIPQKYRWQVVNYIRFLQKNN